MSEPRIALAASPRGWAQALHRHVVDHGGALVRATVLHAQDALTEDYDVFVGDDSTSFLTRRLVDELHRRGRAVLGVFDPDDPGGKGELLDAGVDDLVARDAPPEAFVAAITTLHALLRRPDDEPDPSRPTVHAERSDGSRGPTHAARAGGRVVAVGGAGGGTGATEVAIALAAACGRRGGTAVLVDVDEVAPAVAQRLALPPYPNVRAAIDALDRGSAPLGSTLAPVGASGLLVLAGLSNPRSWTELHPASTIEVLRGLAAAHPTVVANVGPRLEDLAGAGGPTRYGVSRATVAAADAVVGVAAPTPVGMARLLEWVADVRTLTGGAVHVVFNRAPSSPYKRGELAEELARSVAAAGIWFLPSDARVEDAAWAGTLPSAGPFARAVAAAAAAILPAPAVTRRTFRRVRR